MDEIDERSVTARAGHVWSFFECNGSITISGFFKQPTFNRSAKFWLLRRLREHAAIKCGHEIDLSQLRYRHRAYTFCSVWTCCQQTPSDKQQAQPESIGDAVKAHHKGAATQSSGNAGVTAQPSIGPRPIHVLYMHGINQIGSGDSLLFRKGICKYLGECTVSSLGRVYADGPFTVDSNPPALALMGEPIWKSKDEWNASAPFMERYEIKGNGHSPILLDEFNWWPLAYPLKCKWLIARDARLTGPSKPQLSVCAASTTPDPAHPKRFLSYQWIDNSEALELNHAKRRAKILNRSLRNAVRSQVYRRA